MPTSPSVPPAKWSRNEEDAPESGTKDAHLISHFTSRGSNLLGKKEGAKRPGSFQLLIKTRKKQGARRGEGEAKKNLHRRQSLSR